MCHRETFPTPSIVDIAPFLRVPEGSKGPDGCIVCLEDGKGDCARDKHGRPILLSCGMQYGSSIEMQLQMVYSMNRALQYCPPGMLQSSTVVIEVAPRNSSGRTTFRFPDKVRPYMTLQSLFSYCLI
jgi:hypothetical protein